MEEDVKNPRSPQFPFIPLERAILRARQFDAQYNHNWGKVGIAVKVWDYAPKSSGGQQTIGALVGFGLMHDEGSNEERKIRLTPLAQVILKDKRPGMAENAIKEAALRPKVISTLWKKWGDRRPPDAECLSELHLDMGFREEAAQRLLRVYDQTIRFAGLVGGDTTADNDELGRNDEPEVLDAGIAAPAKPVPASPPVSGKVALMQNERVIFAHEIRPNQSFRVVATGDVDQDMVKALKAFAQFQEMLVATTPKPTDGEPK